MAKLRSIALLVVLIILITGLDAKIIPVGNGYKIKTINEAVDLAISGDTIDVSSGKYNENVIITKPIMLRGINFPSINGNKKGDVVFIAADNVTVEGFEIKNSGRSSLEEYCGIKVVESVGVVVRNNKLADNSIGISFKKSYSGIIHDNYVTTSITDMPILGNAIHCWNCDTLSIKRNEVRNHRDGIYLEFVKDSDIEENLVEDCKRYGLHFMFSHRDNYKNNEFRHNGAGVAVMYSHQVKMLSNLFEYNISDISYGLLLKDISDGVISKNKFIKNSIAIYMDGANNLELKSNLFQENGLGIRIVASSSNNLIAQNDFKGNTFDIGTNGRSLNNKFEKNYWDKYRGYDLNKDGFGDIPYRPLSVFSMISEYNPMAMLFFHSIIANLLDLSERVSPSVTPDNLMDLKPSMKLLSND